MLVTTTSVKKVTPKGKRLEKWIKKYHYRLELLRSVAPVVVITLQCIILYHVYFVKN